MSKKRTDCNSLSAAMQKKMAETKEQVLPITIYQLWKDHTSKDQQKAETLIIQGAFNHFTLCVRILI